MKVLRDLIYFIFLLLFVEPRTLFVGFDWNVQYKSWRYVKSYVHNANKFAKGYCYTSTTEIEAMYLSSLRKDSHVNENSELDFPIISINWSQ